MSVLAHLAQKHRARVLAGDDRAGSWARGQARRQQRAFLRDHWWRIGVMLVVVIGGALVASSFMPSGYVSGVLVGGAVVFGAMMIWLLAVQATGTAGTMMGDDAEQWTAQVLRRSRSAGWRIVNHVALERRDVDHVLIGPGGMYAVETKWSAEPWGSAFAQLRLRRAVEQASANARSLHLWHRVPVEPVVVLWGRGLRSLDESEHVRTVDGVSVVAGPSLQAWMAERTVDVLSPVRVAAIWAVLDRYVARRDDVERRESPVPTSALRWAARAGVSVVVLAICGATLGLVLR